MGDRSHRRRNGCGSGAYFDVQTDLYREEWGSKRNRLDPVDHLVYGEGKEERRLMTHCICVILFWLSSALKCRSTESPS